MRNIYDIIIEQKTAIDVKMASHDLEYTITHFTQNQDTYYLQEGFGESAKNLAKKIVEFIKSIINKIRELIKKVVSFFLGTKSEVQKMEEKIAQAEQGGGSSKSEDKGGSGGGSSKSEDKGGSGGGSTKSEDKGGSGGGSTKSEYRGGSGGSTKYLGGGNGLSTKSEYRGGSGGGSSKSEYEDGGSTKHLGSGNGLSTEYKRASSNKGSNAIKLGLNEPKDERAERLKKREEARKERQNSKNIDNGTITNSTSSTVGKVGTSLDGGLERAFREVKGKMVVKNFPPTNDIFMAFAGFGRRMTMYVTKWIEKETVEEHLESTTDSSRKKLDSYCNQATEDVEKMIGGVGRMVQDYIFNAEKVIKEIQAYGKDIEDDLNKIAKETMAKEKEGTLNETISSRLHSAINTLGTFSNKCINLLASGRSHFLQASWKVTNAYCDQLHKERNN